MKKKTNDKLIFAICVVLIGIILLPMIYTIFYSLPSADDFSMAYGCSKGTLLVESIRHANSRFLNWTGLWPYMFIETLLNPMVHFSLESCGLGVEMVLLFLAFITSLFMLIIVASKRILGIESKGTITFCILVYLFVFLNTNIYKEIFYWFVGSSYMMAMTLGLFTVALSIEFFFSPKMRVGGGILLSLSGALACNFFQEAILPGMVFIILWCVFSIKARRPLWKKTIPFWIMFLSGVIAVAAPGNYVRHTRFDSSLNITKACIDAGKIMLVILKHLIQQPLVIILILFCIYIGIRSQKKLMGKYSLIAGALFLITLYCNSFPIALGYAGTSYFPNRIYFVLDFTALAGMVGTFICIGMYVNSLVQYERLCGRGYVELAMLGYASLLLYATLVYNQNISKLPWCQTVSAMREVEEIHDAWQECLVTIRDSKDKNVELEIEERFCDSRVLSLPRLSDNEENWINEAVARYYDKDSVIVREKDE